MKYTFKRFSGLTQGWWLIIKPGPDARTQIEQFPKWGWGFKQAQIDNGFTICVNVAGGYHYLTEKHRSVETIVKDSCDFPLAIEA